jgi:hypothetical protein
MKVFWSWQSDTDGKTGRHFVRHCLADAIKGLNQPEDVDEPTTRPTREEIHLDHDRQGVSGSPDLAPTILKKIDAASVFVCDVTLVARYEVEEANGKKRAKAAINSNVAIEYGYALHKLTDEFILMVQNTHFGSRDDLPFDLKHKAGPIQYELAPRASKAERSKAAADLTRTLVQYLKPFLNKSPPGTDRPHFEETPTTWSPAAYWSRGETLARYGEDFSHWNLPDRNERVEYSFDTQTAFYLRLIPTKPLAEELRDAQLMELVNARKVRLLTRTAGGWLRDRNAYGAIAFEPHGSSTTPMAFTQLLNNGEIWGVTAEFVTELRTGNLIQMPNVPNISLAVLQNWFEVASHLGVEYPMTVEIGCVGIKGFYLPTNRQGGVAGPIHRNDLLLRAEFASPGPAVDFVQEFVGKLRDYAGGWPDRS